MTGADATAVFIIVPVDDVVTTVLNRPVTAVDLENPVRAGLLGGPTGDAVGNVQSASAGAVLCGMRGYKPFHRQRQPCSLHCASTIDFLVTQRCPNKLCHLRGSPHCFSPTSVQFKGEINDALPRKRHQKRHLEFCTA